MKLAIIGGMKKGSPHYQAQRLLVEALKSNIEAVFLSKANIWQTNWFGEYQVFFTPPTINEQWKNNELFIDQKPIQITPDPIKYAVKLSEKKISLFSRQPQLKNWFHLEYFDAFLFLEAGKTRDWLHFLAKYVQKLGKTTVDEIIGQRPGSPSKAKTMYKFAELGIPYPRSISLVTKYHLREILQTLKFPIIIKKSESSKGLGVYKCQNIPQVIGLFKENPHIKIRDCLIQEHINYKGDVRVFVIGKKILGAMRRTPPAGNWKGNIAQGAKGTCFTVTPEMKKIVRQITHQKYVSEILGIDFMLPPTGPIVIETNRVPQFSAFEKVMGINVAAEIIKYVEEKYHKKLPL